MNHIDVKDVETIYGYKENYWIIDGRILPDFLSEWALESKDDNLKLMEPFNGLCPAWCKDLDWNGDIRWVWKLIEMDSVVLPLLLCPEDLDFTCIVIVVEVEKTKNFVYWNRIGYVLHENEDFEEEKKNGILNTSTYSDEDWEELWLYCKAIEIMWKYGDDAVKNVADVTILERLSDEAFIWERFGLYISNEFKDYINQKVLKFNLMMDEVKPLL